MAPLGRFLSKSRRLRCSTRPKSGFAETQQNGRWCRVSWRRSSFVVFLISLGLVLRYLGTGDGYTAATVSVVIKTLVLYTIMITGAIWEREVFGCYLFAPAFFWEDVFSFLVLALHTAYLVMLFLGLGDARDQMYVALAAYATYVVNATQFILKLRAARRDERLAGLREPSVSGSRA